MIKELNETDFQSEVLESEVPVLVDFWNEHCVPCKHLLPVLEQLALELEGRARIFKVDAIANPHLSVRYGIRSVPNLLFFKNGEVRDQVIGAGPIKERLKVKLESLI